MVVVVVEVVFSSVVSSTFSAILLIPNFPEDVPEDLVIPNLPDVIDEGVVDVIGGSGTFITSATCPFD